MKTGRIILAIAAGFALTSCYDDYIMDSDTQGVGFANQTDVRSVIVGEGMKFSTGVALGGVISNDEDRTVNYELDMSLVSDETLSAMQSHSFSYISELMADVDELYALPASEYSLIPEGNAAGKVIIRKGTHLGNIEIQMDSAAFLADETRLSPKYVIPIRITGGDMPLIEGYETTVIGVRYENMLFGNWYHYGKTDVYEADGTLNEELSVSYPFEINQSDTRIWTLTTVAPHALTANAVGNESNGSQAQMRLTIDENSGAVTVEPVDGATYEVSQDGDCTFNRARLLQDRKVFLKYKYERDGRTYRVTDTLQFRNRIRDGVNEWQDENQDHYN